MGDKYVLIVEDEIMLRLVLGDTLRDAGYCVLEAANGDEAMRILLSRQQVDLLITDIRMPGLTDGLLLSVLWRELYPTGPVIIMSGDLPDEATELADALLSKPHSDEMVLALVQQLIGRPCTKMSHNQRAS